MKILHLSDFHIDTFSDSAGTDISTIDQFNTFVDKLISEVTRASVKVDVLITSGDYINQFRTQYFQDASAALTRLASGLGVDPSRIITCPGNHDISRDLDKLDKYEESRVSYTDFSKHFNGYPSESVCTGVYRYDLGSNTVLYTIDSTLHGKGTNMPGDFPEAELLILEENLLDAKNSNNDLIVVSHYPMDIPRNPHLVLDEPGWVDSHVWRDGVLLKNKIVFHRKDFDHSTLFCFGDTHLSDLVAYGDNALSSIVGPFFGVKRWRNQAAIEPTTESIFSECRIYDLDNILSVERLLYRHHSFVVQPDTETKWEFSTLAPQEKIEINSLYESNYRLDYVQGSERKYRDSRTIVLDPDISFTIYEEILNFNLYTFGRFPIVDGYTSLGWVNIAGLISQPVMASAASKVGAMICDDLERNGVDLSCSHLYGVDIWGGAMATQVAVHSKVPVSILVSSENEHTLSNLERHNMSLKCPAHLQSVYLFVDVSSTGATLQRVASKIKKKLPSVKITAISILSDTEQLRTTKLSSVDTIFTLCNKVRIPIIENERLPSEYILPLSSTAFS